MTELRQEIAGLRSRQGDINQLKRQYDFLERKYKETAGEKDRSDQGCSQKLYEGTQVVDSMIKELEELKLYNRQEEARQVDLISQVVHLKKEMAQVQNFKHEAELELKSAHQSNEQERREIEHVQKQIREAQQVNFKNNENLNDLRSKGIAKDKENEHLQYNINSLNKEIQRNKQAIQEMENQQQDLMVKI